MTGEAYIEKAIRKASAVILKFGMRSPITVDGLTLPTRVDEKPETVDKFFGFTQLDDNAGRMALFFIRNSDANKLPQDTRFQWKCVTWTVRRITTDADVMHVLLCESGGR